MNIIKDSRPLEPVPVVSDDNRVTEWIPSNCPEVDSWYNWISSTGLRALIVERTDVQHAGSVSRRAVFRHPAAMQRPE